LKELPIPVTNSKKLKGNPKRLKEFRILTKFLGNMDIML